MLTPEEVKKIAKLANLTLTESEVATYASQLSEVLNYISVLNELDTSTIPPTFQVTGQKNIFRDDTVSASLSQAESLKNAKETKNGYFVTGRVKAGI